MDKIVKNSKVDYAAKFNATYQVSFDSYYQNCMPQEPEEKDEEFEKAILKEGRITDPVYAYKGVLVDGYRRAIIAMKHNLTLTVDNSTLDSYGNKETVLQWKIMRDLTRRHLSNIAISDLWGRLYESLKKEPLDNLLYRQKENKNLKNKGSETENNTAQMLAEKLGKSKSTIEGSGRLHRNLNKIEALMGAEIRNEILILKWRLSKGDIKSVADTLKEAEKQKDKDEALKKAKDYVLCIRKLMSAENYMNFKDAKKKIMRDENTKNPPKPLEGEIKLNEIYFADIRDVLKKLPNKSINIIIADPLYGTNSKKVTYDDKPETLEKLLKDTVLEFKRVLKDDGYLLLFFAFKNIVMVKEILEEVFVSNDTPLIWEKLGMPLSNTKSQGVVNYGDYSFFYSKGTGRVLRKDLVSNIFKAKVDTNQLIDGQKPIELIKQFFDVFTYEGDVILEPFAGSAPVAVTSLLTGRNFISVDNSKASYEKAKKRIEDTKKEIEAKKDKPKDED